MTEQAGQRPRHDCGYRSVPHTADLRSQAWGPTWEDCIAAAVRGLVESFAQVGASGERRVREHHLTANSDAELVAAAIDEVIYSVDAQGQIPVAVQARRAADGGIDLTLQTVRTSAAQIVGAAPKAATMSGLTCAPGPDGRWSCAVTIDV